MDITHLPKEQLRNGAVYRLLSRNLSIGVWVEASGGFIGIRQKFTDEFLFTEYLSRECGGKPDGFDTAYPIECVGQIPTEIPLREHLGVWCRRCGNPVVGAEYTRGSCGVCEKSDGVWRSNSQLFDLLKTFV